MKKTVQIASRWFKALLLCVVMLCGFTAKSWGVTIDAVVDGIYYSYRAGDAAVVGIASDNHSTSITIPPTVKIYSYTCKVTQIGDFAFQGNSYLQRVSLPSSIVKIGDFAFSGCTSLSTIVNFSYVKTLGAHAFEGCISLSQSGLSVGSLTSVGEFAFSECGFTYIPSSLYKFLNVEGIFNFCQKLTYVSIPSPTPVTTIGDKAFAGCTGITSVSLSGITRISNYAFNGCSSLTTVTIPSSVTGVGNYAFSHVKTLNMNSPTVSKYDKLIGDITRQYGENITKIVFGDGCTTIGKNWASGLSNLTSVTFPSGALTIGEGAFWHTGISGSRSFTGCTIGKEAFAETKLTSVTLNNCTVGSEAFAETSLTSATISGGQFEPDAFWLCGSLATLTLSGVVVPENSLFGALKTLNINSGSKSTTIDPRAFVNSPSLKTITIADAASVTVYQDAFQGLSGITSLTLGSNVWLYGNALRGATIGTLVLPNLKKCASTALTGLECNKLRITDTNLDSYAVGKGPLRNTTFPTIELPNATSVGDNFFEDCQVTFLDAPQLTGINQLLGCMKHLKSAYINNSTLVSNDDGTMVYSADYKTLKFVCLGADKVLTLDSRCTIIDLRATYHSGQSTYVIPFIDASAIAHNMDYNNQTYQSSTGYTQYRPFCKFGSPSMGIF